ncbi:MAG: NnrS family protein [Alphaproteobacteria bacterium]|nr:NnrS family protein [Alphaproteobacteria bacterium]
MIRSLGRRSTVFLVWARQIVAAIPRYHRYHGPALLSAGFRPFFVVAALWAAVVIPLWLAFYAGASAVPTALPPTIWHVHEMVFGYATATVAGFLLTAIPNWTGRMPLQGTPLVALVLLWAAGRAGVMLSAQIGAATAAVADLVFPIAFLAVVGREIVAGRNWRNLPMLAALAFLLAGNLLVHLEAFGWTATAELGNRLGVATLLMLISFVGGRIVPSFTRNWLAKHRSGNATPAGFDWVDRTTLVVTAVALVVWTIAPDAAWTAWPELATALAVGIRLARWRGGSTLREPLLWVLHLGYGWLALGFLLLAVNGFAPLLPATTALHALTVGAIGTMTLAVMTRASLGHTGRPLVAGTGTTTIYVLITLAAVLRLLAPLAGAQYLLVLSLAGAAWSGAFGLFAVLYGPPLMSPRAAGEAARPI